MKKKILLCLSVLILAASCGQSVINSNKESEVANQQKIVEEPFYRSNLWLESNWL